MPKIAELKVDGGHVWARLEMPTDHGSVELLTDAEKREVERQSYNLACDDAIDAAQRAIIDSGHGKTMNQETVRQIVGDINRMRKRKP